MKQLDIMNRLGETVSFGASSPFQIISFDTNGAEANILSTTGYKQDGISVNDVTLQEKQLPLEFYTQASNKQGLYENRRQINRVLSPKLQPFTLKFSNGYGNFEIEAALQAAPVFQIDDEKFLIAQRGLAHFIATDPYWRAQEPITVPLIAWYPAFVFPINFGDTVYFDQKGEQKQVQNNGDAESPITIDIYGPALNPEITNLTTGATIRIKRNIAAGQHIRIVCKYGQNKLELVKSDGTTDNVLNWLDIARSTPLSDFKLAIGTNIFDFTADVGQASATVVISANESYIGI